MGLISADIFKLYDDSDFNEVIDSLILELDSSGKSNLSSIISMLNKPVTLIVEYPYVDRVFRDSYYSHFSSKHFDVDRYCKRVSLFEGEVCDEDFYTKNGHDKLRNQVIGFITIRPISHGCIGRTILDPNKLCISRSYIRTTTFNFVLFGVKLNVEAFPFSNQDTETMSCAETTVWCILEYYGHRYPEYKIVNPSDILTALSKNAFERVVPTRGLRYTQVASLFKEFGFTPRLYFADAYKSAAAHESKEFRRLFHYYVESGIPLAVAVEGVAQQIDSNKIVGHSVVCIGHSANIKNIEDAQHIQRQNNIAFTDTADYVDEYVLMDDNKVPYEIKKFTEFTSLMNPKVIGFAVPLNKRIFLEAGDARAIALNILSHDKYGIHTSTLAFEGHNNRYDPATNPIVVRLFLTSSRQYKHFKSLNAGDVHMAKIITHLQMPKFVWVAELSLKTLYYNEKKVFGEIIIDATASRFTNLDSLLLLHYPGFIGWRTPTESLANLFKRLEYRYDALLDSYPLYTNNLSSRR